MGVLDNLDYKQLARGAGKGVKGLVKAYRPESASGMDEAGSGLGDILGSLGISMDEKPAPEKSVAKKFYDFGTTPTSTPKSGALPPPPPPTLAEAAEPVAEPVAAQTAPPEAAQESDRDLVAALLTQRGWAAGEVENILAGPPAGQSGAPKPGRRVVQQPGRRVPLSTGRPAGNAANPVSTRYATLQTASMQPVNSNTGDIEQ